MKKRVLLSILLLSVITLAIPVAATQGPEESNSPALRFKVTPVKVEELKGVGEGAIADPVPWNVDMVNAEATENDGEGIYVAVLDTGLLSNYLDFFPEDMVDIREEWGKGYTHDVFWTGPGGNFSGEFSYGPLRDDRGFITHDSGNPDMWGLGWGSGHGTHVTSIITGFHFWKGDIDTWIEGVAPKVTIIPVLVLDDWIVFHPNGTGYFYHGGTDEMVAAGIRYVGDLAGEHGVKIIINMSLGGPSPAPILEEAIDYAINRGVIVVASAGNEGEEGMGWPGAYPQVISTAAAGWTQEYGGGDYEYYWWLRDVPEKLNTKNHVFDVTTNETYHNNWQTYLTDFSSRPNRALGQSMQDLDVAAPGAAVRGPYKPYGPTQWGFYGVWGTSQSAPHVSGVSALVLQSYGGFDQYLMERALKHASGKLPLPADGAYVSDVFSDFAVLHYYWNDHDAGSGFLTADQAMKSAKTIK